MGDELRAARRREGFIAKRRYRPEQWDEVMEWRTYRAGGERWFGFEAVRDLDGLPPEILMIPLPGHTWGHAGVAVDTPDGWLLNAADTYFVRHEVDRPERECPPGARAYQRMMAMDHELHLHNQDRVRDLAHDEGAGVRIFCSHDPIELEALQRLSGSEARSRNAGTRAGQWRGETGAHATG
jgi:glyoxylase-like metal-dependent hydrolase (beta-lactamase superfamily II)